MTATSDPFFLDLQVECLSDMPGLTTMWMYLDFQPLRRAGKQWRALILAQHWLVRARGDRVKFFPDIINLWRA